jgi:hypothetical protein
MVLKLSEVRLLLYSRLNINQSLASLTIGMALVRKARLSVQRVDERTWGIIKMLAEKGGWDEMNFGKKANSADTGKLNKSEKGGKAKARKNIREEEEEVTEEDAKFESAGAARKSTTARRKQSQTSEGNLKRKAKEQDGVNTGTQRSTRAKK